MWILREMGLDPRPVDMGPDLGKMLDRCDGALLIGDRALDEAARHPELIRMDLGQAWKELTGFPMIFAVYAARRDAPNSVLNEVHKLFLNQLYSFENSTIVRNKVIEATSKRSGFSQERIDKYFGEVINRLDDNGDAGLRHFLTEVCNVKEYQMLQH
ncbi:MAG: hypothetical protein CMO63_04255 [Verrucomicrobiales bacterium]|nr:hypothetical protein [Verrucomicrobiales bacterium]